VLLGFELSAFWALLPSLTPIFKIKFKLSICISQFSIYQEINQLKKREFILAHGFRPWLVISFAFEPVVKQNIMMGMCGGAKLLTS
jgi:hypothetical protein